MPVEIRNGDMFREGASVLVNTVNCVGVMGAGVALAFKTKYPDMFKEYKKLCAQGVIRPGKPFVWEQELLGITIINLPTKDDWRNPSTLEYIELGIAFLYDFLKDRGAIKVALPALGCGHGKLDFSIVSKMIMDKLGGLEAEIILFEPECSRQLPKTAKSCDINYDELERKGILVFPPKKLLFLNGVLKNTTYVRGKIFGETPQGVALLSSYKPQDAEIVTYKKIVHELLENKVLMTVGYSAVPERPALKYILSKLMNVIVLFSEGINRFSIRKDIESAWDDDLVSVVSISSPDASWKKYETMNLRLFAILSTKATIVTDPNPTWLLSLATSVLAHHKIFFINYEQNCDELKKLLVEKGIKPIGPRQGTLLPDLTQVFDLL